MGSELICMPGCWVDKRADHAAFYHSQRGSRRTWQPTERLVVCIAVERHLIPVIAPPDVVNECCATIRLPLTVYRGGCANKLGLDRCLKT
jgi:hypothetical protein